MRAVVTGKGGGQDQGIHAPLPCWMCLPHSLTILVWQAATPLLGTEGCCARPAAHLQAASLAPTRAACVAAYPTRISNYLTTVLLYCCP